MPGLHLADESAIGSEVGTWSAVRDPDTVHPWGVATFDLDPGDRRDGALHGHGQRERILLPG